MLVATAWMPVQVLRQRRNRPFFAVDLVSRYGMGALLSDALLCCAYAEDSGLIPRITSTNPLYASEPGHDFLARFFLNPPAGPVEKALQPMPLRTLYSFYHLDFKQHVPLDRASHLFRSHFAPRPALSDRIEAVREQAPGRRFDLSIHYRGTDKAREAPLVDFTHFEQAVRNASGAKDPGTVFLATDDTAFEDFIRKRFPSTAFTTFNLGQPADASGGRHFSNLDPHDKALEALVNMFLLAAAPVCIRSSSYMSAMSKVIDPALRTVSLNRTHTGSDLFPEREILANEARTGTV